MLINEIMPLIKQERKKGITQPTNLADSFGIFPIILGRSVVIYCFQNFVFNHYAIVSLTRCDAAYKSLMKNFKANKKHSIERTHLMVRNLLYLLFFCDIYFRLYEHGNTSSARSCSAIPSSGRRTPI